MEHTRSESKEKFATTSFVDLCDCYVDFWFSLTSIALYVSLNDLFTVQFASAARSCTQSLSGRDEQGMLCQLALLAPSSLHS